MQRGRASQKVERLEDEADLLVADAREFVIVQLRNIVAVEPVLAFTWGVEAPDKVHQRGLARTRWSHDGDVLVVLDAEIDAAQGIDLLIAHLVGLPEIVGNDDVSGTGTAGVGVGFGADYFLDFSGHPVLRCISAASKNRERVQVRRATRFYAVVRVIDRSRQCYLR